jgi:hypothetical protein
MSRFETYWERFLNARPNRSRTGVPEVALHTNDGKLLFNGQRAADVARSMTK